MRTKHGSWKIAVAAILVFAAFEAGGVGGCGGGVSRAFTGTINSTSLSGLRLKNHFSSKEQTSLSCTDLKVVCVGYTGSDTTGDIGSDCKFKLDLPLESFCFCGIFSKSDDSFVASLGCSENGFEGAIPIFGDADDEEDEIDLGGVSIEGNRAVVSATGNPCSQVDQDNDGRADSSDDDDDADGTLDGADFLNGEGCEEADNFDSDDDDIPDIFESEWDDLDDGDGDDIPDFCDGEDEETGCEADSEDTDGDCVPDEFDDCLEDADGDGVPDCLDCNNASTDLSVSLACFDEFCTIDTDGDNLGLCDDCDDEDASIGSDCEEFDDFDPCAVDADNDGVDLCDDCDDGDAAIGLECESCELASCDGSFDCQQFAEDELAEGEPVCEGNSVSCLTCTDGCCVQ